MICSVRNGILLMLPAILHCPLAWMLGCGSGRAVTLLQDAGLAVGEDASEGATPALPDAGSGVDVTPEQGNDGSDGAEADDTGSQGDDCRALGLGALSCDGGCVPAGDVHNCGACGASCGDTASLCAPTPDHTSYECAPTCPSFAATSCGGRCVDLDNDGANCGTCGHDCLGGSCNAGRCKPVILASGVTPYAIALDGQNVYWTNDDTVRKCAKSGCNGKPVVFPSYRGPFPSMGGGAIAVDSHNVYWIAGSALLMCDAESCSQSTILVSPVSSDSLQGLVVDSTALYFTDAMSGSVQRCLTPGCVLGLTLASSLDQPSAIAEDPANVYWLGGSDAGTIMSCDKARCNGNPSVLATGLSHSLTLAVDATSIYWIGSGDNTLTKCTIAACDSQTSVLATALPSPTSLAVDSDYVYWTNMGPADATNGSYSHGTLMKCAIGGCNGQPVTIASDLNISGPNAIATDDSGIYWTNPGGGTVMRLAK